MASKGRPASSAGPARARPAWAPVRSRRSMRMARRRKVAPGLRTSAPTPVLRPAPAKASALPSRRENWRTSPILRNSATSASWISSTVRARPPPWSASRSVSSLICARSVDSGGGPGSHAAPTPTGPSVALRLVSLARGRACSRSRRGRWSRVSRCSRPGLEDSLTASQPARRAASSNSLSMTVLPRPREPTTRTVRAGAPAPPLKESRKAARAASRPARTRGVTPKDGEKGLDPSLI